MQNGGGNWERSHNAVKLSAKSNVFDVRDHWHTLSLKNKTKKGVLFSLRTVSWPRRPCFRSRFDLFRHDKSCESYERSLRQSFGLQEGNVLGCWSTQKGYSFAKSTRLMLEARLTFTPSKRVASKTLPPDPSTSNWSVVKTSNVIHVSLSQRVSIFYCEVEQKREMPLSTQRISSWIRWLDNLQPKPRGCHASRWTRVRSVRYLCPNKLRSSCKQANDHSPRINAIFPAQQNNIKAVDSGSREA